MYATDLMGLTLDNPVIIAPGPWSRGEKLKDALQCNAGAIITESIVSESPEAIRRFQQMVDAACVYANVSTAFTDGAQFGFGAEIGISTQKLHARGPMALPELTTYKYIIEGDGQIRK